MTVSYMGGGPDRGGEANQEMQAPLTEAGGATGGAVS